MLTLPQWDAVFALVMSVVACVQTVNIPMAAPGRLSFHEGREAPLKCYIFDKGSRRVHKRLFFKRLRRHHSLQGAGRHRSCGAAHDGVKKVTCRLPTPETRVVFFREV